MLARAALSAIVLALPAALADLADDAAVPASPEVMTGVEEPVEEMVPIEDPMEVPTEDAMEDPMEELVDDDGEDVTDDETEPDVEPEDEEADVDDDGEEVADEDDEDDGEEVADEDVEDNGIDVVPEPFVPVLPEPLALAALSPPYVVLSNVELSPQTSPAVADLSALTAEDATACAEACSVQEGCMFATWMGANPDWMPAQNCYLKGVAMLDCTNPEGAVATENVHLLVVKTDLCTQDVDFSGEMMTTGLAMPPAVGPAMDMISTSVAPEAMPPIDVINDPFMGAPTPAPSMMDGAQGGSGAESGNVLSGGEAAVVDPDASSAMRVVAGMVSAIALAAGAFVF